MVRLFILAIVFMQTSNKLVIYDLDRDASYHTSDDILLFVYDMDDLSPQIEVTEGYANEEESRRSPSEKESYSLSKEFKDALNYWNNYNNKPNYERNMGGY